MENSIILWSVFGLLLSGLLALDLGIFHPKNRKMGFKESLWLAIFYTTMSLIFGLWIGYTKGFESFTKYITAFLVEKSLALDNIFFISMIFSSLSIPLAYQHRVLFWGMLWAIPLRGLVIGLGTQLITQFEWMISLFGGIMIFMGIKMFFPSEKPMAFSRNVLLVWMKKRFRITQEIHGENFFISQKDPKSQRKKIFITPLLMALMLIECTDLIFALDSIPAAFSITQDPYILYTSNIFAVLGLRAFYFTLASIMDRFCYLNQALSTILIFMGVKILITDTFNIVKISPTLSLAFTIFVLFSGVFLSLFKKKAMKK